MDERIVLTFLCVRVPGWKTFLKGLAFILVCQLLGYRFTPYLDTTAVLIGWMFTFMIAFVAALACDSDSIDPDINGRFMLLVLWCFALLVMSFCFTGPAIHQPSVTVSYVYAASTPLAWALTFMLFRKRHLFDYVKEKWFDKLVEEAKRLESVGKRDDALVFYRTLLKKCATISLAQRRVAGPSRGAYEKSAEDLEALMETCKRRIDFLEGASTVTGEVTSFDKSKMVLTYAVKGRTHETKVRRPFGKIQLGEKFELKLVPEHPSEVLPMFTRPVFEESQFRTTPTEEVKPRGRSIAFRYEVGNRKYLRFCSRPEGMVRLESQYEVLYKRDEPSIAYIKAFLK